MKKTTSLLLSLLIAGVGFCQNTGKIQLKNGQKIVATNAIVVEADLGMGMQLNSNSTTENTLEVKNSTDKDYTITSTLTKMKVDFNLAGQSTSYDSEKNPTPSSDIEKSLAEKLNKPVDVLLDNTTGTATPKEKKEKKEDEDDNPMTGLMNSFAESSDDAVVSGAFGLIPAGKKVGDSWSDSSKVKNQSVVRSYTLKSITGNEAVIQMDAVSTASNKLDFQGMEFEFKSTTKSASEIITDIATGQLKTKTTKSDITGSIQLMGQDMPVTAKVNSSSTYK